MRPYRFPQMAPNTGLVVGSAVANGLNNALRNYAQMRMQKAQMQARQQQAQGMMEWRKAQAESLRQKSMSADMAKLDMLTSASKAGQYNPAAVKKFETQYMGSVLDKMTPEEAQSAKQRFDKMAEQGQLAPEFSPYTSLNPNETKLYGQMAGNQTKENVAGTQAGARVNAAQIYGDTRENVANIGAGARVDAAKIAAGSKPSLANRADMQSMKDVNSQILKTQASLSALDKPPPFGMPPMDDAAKATLRNKYTQDIVDLHGQYQTIHGRLSGGAGAAQPPAASPQPGAGAAQSSARTLPWEQRTQANVGDTVMSPRGPHVVAGKDPSGALLYAPVPQAAPAPGAAPPASAPAPAGFPPPAPSGIQIVPSAPGGQ